jgi:phenylalanine-4-hydroxylase
MKSQEQIIKSLPAHLRPFVATQDYASYSARDHAVWRFLLHQLKTNLSETAHPTYIEGLEKTGIGLESIPRIEDINDCLSNIGWRAVVVDGFLPPAVFMEFQAIKVLVIAVNMRSYNNMMYTPAPDIVHESAGHAPFLIDIDYAEFLQRFGELGMQAVATQHDIDVYNAVRQLSIMKEKADATSADISAAEQTLEQLQSLELAPSEASLLARLHWWTVEYGLVGEVDNYTIFGAGLLSSLAESESCLNDKNVIKKPLTVNAIESSYDITAAQPQLYVTESCRHMSQVLEEFGRHMCCHRGGASALNEAKSAASVNTVQLNSGLQIAGVISRVICDAVGNAIYFNTSGPTQLAYKNIELEGQGTFAHAQGFGSPIGRLRAMERCLSCYTVDELKRHHIEVGRPVRLNFLSGICVRGELKTIIRREQKNVLLCFVNCSVEDADGKLLFDPAWGDYDMAIGDSVTGVSGGSADQARFPQHETPSTHVTQEQHYDDDTKIQFALYAELRECREQQADISSLLARIAGMKKCDWLLSFEALELAQLQNLDPGRQEILRKKLNQETGEASVLIKHGLKRLGFDA